MENQVIMYDWLVALVGYILGDQIFVIGSLIVSCKSFIFQKDGDKNYPAQPRTQSCGDVNCNLEHL